MRCGGEGEGGGDTENVGERVREEEILRMWEMCMFFLVHSLHFPPVTTALDTPSFVPAGNELLMS